MRIGEIVLNVVFFDVRIISGHVDMQPWMW